MCVWVEDTIAIQWCSEDTSREKIGASLVEFRWGSMNRTRIGVYSLNQRVKYCKIEIVCKL